MPMRSRLAFLPAFAVFCCCGPATISRGLAADGEEKVPNPNAAKAEGRKLLREGDKLADQKKYDEAVSRYKEAFERLLPNLRKIPFKNEVKRDETTRKELRAYLIKELDEDQTPEEFQGDEIGLKAIGVIPRSMDLHETMARLLTEEVAAFYDPKTKAIHTIKEDGTVKRPERGFLERLLLGKKEEFDKEENKTVLAHELTHALADQHYDLLALQRKIKADDDRELALSALIEGEATLTMTAAQGEDWDGDETIKLPAARMEGAIDILGPLLTRAGGATLREAPPILAETLIFPYMRGLIFCMRLANEGGWKAIDEAYENPPLSTEQVLHFEKYRGPKRDEPTRLELGKLDAGEGWKEVGRNVFGEWQIDVMLRGRPGSKTASAGWDGDRYAAFVGPNDRLGLVWATTWDSERDAREFAEAYASFQTAKLGKDAARPGAFGDRLRRSRDDAVFAIERQGADVAIVEGFPSETAERLIQTALAAKKSPKTQAPTPEAVRAEKDRKKKEKTSRSKPS